MKFLLAAINAKYIHSNPAIYSLRAYAGEELQSCVELAEYTINQPMQESWLTSMSENLISLVFLLYMELEAGSGAAQRTAEASAGHACVAGRAGGDL